MLPPAKAWSLPPHIIKQISTPQGYFQWLCDNLSCVLPPPSGDTGSGLVIDFGFRLLGQDSFDMGSRL